MREREKGKERRLKERREGGIEEREGREKG